jgi:hypothetical protein
MRIPMQFLQQATNCTSLQPSTYTEQNTYNLNFAYSATEWRTEQHVVTGVKDQ